MYCQCIIQLMINDVDIKIVTTDDEYAQMMSVRRQVFVDEHHIPENMEFDGNDHSSTHVLAVADGKPVGTMRIRYFNGFVKMERMCVLKPYRKTDVSERIMRKGMEFSAQKGYDKVYGICKKELLNRWMKDGFKPIPGAMTVEQNGMTLIPIYCDLQVPENSLTMQTPTEILNMKEGSWYYNEKNQTHLQNIYKMRDAVRAMRAPSEQVSPAPAKVNLNNLNGGYSK